MLMTQGIKKGSFVARVIAYWAEAIIELVRKSRSNNLEWHLLYQPAQKPTWKHQLILSGPLALRYTFLMVMSAGIFDYRGAMQGSNLNIIMPQTCRANIVGIGYQFATHQYFIQARFTFLSEAGRKTARNNIQESFCYTVFPFSLS